MTRLTVIAIILGATLLAGCSVSKEGTSLSENKWVDNNCSGNGFLVNESGAPTACTPRWAPTPANSDRLRRLSVG